MRITLEDLQAQGACYWKNGERVHELADRVEQNLPATLHEIMQWDRVPVGDREWVFLRFARASAREAYKQATASAWEAYEQATASALIEHNKEA